MVSISVRIVTINAEKNTKYPKKYCTEIYIYKRDNIIAVSNSMNGYKNEIGCLQDRHFPLRRNQERTGMLSYQAISAEQQGHDDRGVMID